MAQKCYLQEVASEPNATLTETSKRKVETPTTAETSESPAPVRQVKKQKSDESAIAPRALFQDEVEFMTDEQHNQSASSSRGASSKRMKENNEPDWMVMLKGLMAQRTQELKLAVRESASGPSSGPW